MKTNKSQKSKRATSSVQRVVKQRIVEKCMDLVPTSWLDSLLTGHEKVIGEPPYTAKDIVALCEGIRTRMLALAQHELP